MKMLRASLLFCLAGLCLTGSAFGQIRAMAGEVKETRRTDGFFNKLEIELKLIGDALAEARGVRVTVEKAVDSTGKNLIPDKKEAPEFKELESSERENVKVDIELKNASRQAMEITEISGTIEVFAPTKDPRATITLLNILKTTGKPIVNPALKTAEIEVVFWTREQYQAQRKAEEEKIKKEIEARKKKAGEGAPGEDIGEAMAEGLMKIFGGLFSSFSEMGENAVALQVTDPKAKIIGLEFVDAEGKTIDRQSRMTMGSEPKTYVYEFEKPLPETARLKLYVMTPRALIKSPFRMSGIPLP